MGGADDELSETSLQTMSPPPAIVVLLILPLPLVLILPHPFLLLPQIVTPLLQRPDGLPVFYLSRLLLGPAWRMYVFTQKQKLGVLDKVS